MLKRIIIPAIFLMSTMGCNSSKDSTETSGNSTAASRVTTAPFGAMEDGTSINEYTMTNANGMVIKVINYGGIITSILAPDRNGKMDDVVLGYDSLWQYVQNNPYFGALIGRYGNRIAKGKFTLDGKQYTLATNNGANHLHGGVKGFDKVVWDIVPLSSDSSAAIKLSYRSTDMEEGYPGNLDVTVIYRLTDANELQLEYSATTDKKTIVNLTQHSYFNLNGATADITRHELQINASKYLPVDNTLIPEGKPADVGDGDLFDFRKPKRIGDGLARKFERETGQSRQLAFGKGYDHCWVLDRSGNETAEAAVLYDSTSGREVRVMTTEPGIQFYSGNFLDGSNIGKGGVKYGFRYGLCLETQHFPDSPNQPSFPSVTLVPGETYRTSTTYKFGTR
jgi:aldose 1-epimerase